MRFVWGTGVENSRRGNDSAASVDVDLLDALLLRFVEDLIMEGSINVPSSNHG